MNKVLIAILILLLIVSLALSIVGIIKAHAGPQGPTGPRGVRGVPGPVGNSGPVGPSGPVDVGRGAIQGIENNISTILQNNTDCPGYDGKEWSEGKGCGLKDWLKQYIIPGLVDYKKWDHPKASSTKMGPAAINSLDDINFDSTLPTSCPSDFTFEPGMRLSGEPMCCKGGRAKFTTTTGGWGCKTASKYPCRLKGGKWMCLKNGAIGTTQCKQQDDGTMQCPDQPS